MRQRLTSEADGFAEILRRHRIAAGLTQQDVANRAALSVRAVSDLERGIRRHPYPDTVDRLAVALQLTDAERSRLQTARRAPRTESSNTTSGGRRLADELIRGASRGNLSPQPNSFVGREHALAHCQRLLRISRLVTLTGLGGVGKTRLATAIADAVVSDFDEVWIVLLAGVSDPALVLPTIARTLGLQQTGAQKPADMLRHYLETCSAVLVLDNCEHVLEAAAELAELLSDCPRLRLLVTSRERLRLQCERIYVVPPLELPECRGGSDPAVLSRSPAVRLFMDRAVVTDPGFVLDEHNAGTVAELCRQLDGLPLAIELASAQVATTPPDVILSRIHRRLDLLVGFRDQPLRQRTLKATLEWSYDLLTENEQRLFRRLAVFAGGWTLDAAETVCSGADLDSAEIVSLLGRLVERSLVIWERVRQGYRYRLLETVREYALAQLSAAGDEKHIRGRHRAWCLELAAFTAPRSFVGESEVAILQRLEPELDNLRAALNFSVTEPADSGAETGLRLAAQLGRFWELRGHPGEGFRWLEMLLGLADEPGPNRVDALYQSAWLAFMQADLSTAMVRLEEGLALARDVSDPVDVAFGLAMRGVYAHLNGNSSNAATVLHDALKLAEAQYGRAAIAYADLARFWLATLATGSDAHGQAVTVFEQFLASRCSAGDWLAQSYAVGTLGYLAISSGDFVQAETLLQRAVRLQWEAGALNGLSQSLTLLGWSAALRGHARRAAWLLGAEEELRERIGAPAAWTSWSWMAPTPWMAGGERVLSLVREALGKSAFRSAWNDGRTTQLEEVIASVLEHDSTTSPEHRKHWTAGPAGRG